MFVRLRVQPSICYRHFIFVATWQQCPNMTSVSLLVNLSIVHFIYFVLPFFLHSKYICSFSASFGGIFSLFLGLSFITVIEVLYYFAIRPTINWRKFQSNQETKLKRRKKILNAKLTNTKITPQIKNVYTIYK